MIDDNLIPPLPQVVGQVLKFDPADQVKGAFELESIVSPDKSITSELLRVANSAFYGRSGRVKVLKDAITLLGLKAVKNLILFLSTKSFSAGARGPTFKKYLHDYPIIAALSAQEIARQLRHPEISEEIFLVVLLQKIGMTFLALAKGEHYSMLIEQAEKSGTKLPEMEKKIYSVNHEELSRQAAIKWNLPETYAKVMSVNMASDAMSLESDMEKISLFANLVACHACGINVKKEDEDNVQLLYMLYGGQGNLREKFCTPEFIAKIKSHPYCQLS